MMNRNVEAITKIISIYLPQFHSIPENDMWWEKDFTEWTNVRRGRPFFPGHYQPRIPYNYYDLSDQSVLEAHTDMAQQAGIYGFAFYHYYVKGKTLLENPIHIYRDYSKKKFPYCLIWANQSWVRTWYRSDTVGEILLKQDYGEREDWINHFKYLCKFFCDNRYIKIDNKPVYIMYLPQDIVRRKEMFETWHECAVKCGFDGLYLIAMNTWNGMDKRFSLYDAYMNFEPFHSINLDMSIRNQIRYLKRRNINKIKDKTHIKNYLFSDNTYSYKYLCKLNENEKNNMPIKTYYGAFSGWDNTARKDESGMIVRGSNPKIFENHILKMLKKSSKENLEYLFINAWNEWSEGAYLEPDKRFGTGYLDAIKRVVESF